jgi:SAM-dependent methyltransferase
MFSLDTVVPWGRSFDEYARMFSLSEDDLRGRVLGCGDGPASFNAEATRRGIRVVSCDPLYQFSPLEIGRQIDATYETVIAETRRNQEEFVWTDITSVEELGARRRAAMDIFLSDYAGRHRRRGYVAGALPLLPFRDRAFDLALCSHFLFLYSEQHDAAFHVDAVADLCRTAREVRIFPLLMLGSRPSPHVPIVAEMLRERGLRVSIDTVAYELQRGGNQMMRATAA